MIYKDKVVIVTGAASGIGRALAISYAEHGAKLVAIDKNRYGLGELESFLKNAGKSAYTYEVDLSHPQEIRTAFKDIRSLLERVDVLINNAGLGVVKSLFEISVDEWDYVVNTNLRGTFLCSQEVARIMTNIGGGSIINIASTRALMSEPNTFPYSASKGGIVALTHSLAVSLGPHKIRVNAVSPGWIQTESYQDLSAADHSQHPAGRVGKTEDIVRACLYLSDPANDFVTGINLVVDGGMTHKMIYEE